MHNKKCGSLLGVFDLAAQHCINGQKEISFSQIVMNRVNSKLGLELKSYQSQDVSHDLAAEKRKNLNLFTMSIYACPIS